MNPTDQEFDYYFAKQLDFLCISITNVLQRFDFVGIGSLRLEYQPEGEAIAKALVYEQIGASDEPLRVAELVRATIEDWFGLQFCSPTERYMHVADVILNIYKTSLWIYPLYVIRDGTIVDENEKEC